MKTNTNTLIQLPHTGRMLPLSALQIETIIAGLSDPLTKDPEILEAFILMHADLKQ